VRELARCRRLSLLLLALAGSAGCGGNAGVPSVGIARTLAASAHAGAPAKTEPLQAVLDEARRQTHTPGVAAVIMSDGAVVWSGTSGVVDKATQAPVTAQTLFSLASVTKMFVATLVLRLHEEGKLRLDDPIAEYVPAYVPSSH
jgi:CubicO group peptidase (beta-lactamase class C family)